MKKILLFLSFLLMSIGVFGTEYSFFDTQSSELPGSWAASGGTKTINGITWTYSSATYLSLDNSHTKIQVGSSKNPQTSNWTISTSVSNFGTITSISITAYTTAASATYDIGAGGSSLKSGNLTTSSNTYSIGNLNVSDGDIVVTLKGSSTSKAMYLCNISITYTDSSPTTYTVTYDANGGTGTMTDLNNPYNSGATVTVLANTFTRDNYEFDRWNTAANGSGVKYDADDTFKITDNTTLYAQWIKNTPEPTPEPTIDVAVWDTGYVKITIDNFNATTALLEDKDTQHTQEKNVATKLFFSKYFEAAGNNKMIAIYNGTPDTLDLSQYYISKAETTPTILELRQFGQKTGYILPGEEIIFARFDNKTSAKSCADTLDGFNNWIQYTEGDKNTPDGFHNTMTFGGRASLGIYKKGLSVDTLIDVIGSHNNGTLMRIGKSCQHAKITEYNDDAGYYTYSGDSVHGNSDDYFLSTNRCLLIRKNTVHSGDTAVKYNIYDTFDDCCTGIAESFVTLSSEWMGFRIGTGSSSSDEINSLTCTGLSELGKYDYGNYYAQFTEIVSDTALSQIIDSDSTYKFTYDFTDLSCTELKIIVKDTTDKNNIKSHEETFRIPIFIYNNSTVKSFKEKNCKECDVVVMGGGVLTVDAVELESRNVTVYPGGRLIVPIGKKYKMNSLTLRRDNNDVPHLLNNGTITLENDSNYFFELRTDASDWRWTTLPSSHRVCDIKEHNGKPIKLGSEVFVRNYNGKTRAETQGNGWENTKPDSILGSGQGFIFGIDVKGSKKKIYKFKFPSDSVNNEKSNKTIMGLRAWGCNDENLAPNHKGWNLVGNPFTDNDTTDIIDPIKTGELVKDSTGTSWNGQWVYKAGSEARNLRYAVIPVPWSACTADEAAAGGYASELLDDYVLPPFTSFFVQIGGDASKIKTLTFKPVGANPINRIVARAPQYDEDEELFLRVKVGERKTGCFISNKFTDEYEPGDDLESRYPIYQSIGGYKLLYSAINDSIIEHGVQVTAPQGTLYLDPKVDINKFEYIYAHYNDEWYDLKNGQTVEVNGTFILQAKRQTQNVATGLDETNSNNKFSKYIYEGNIYIRKNNHIFTVLGEFVK